MKQKDAAYLERNKVVAALARCFPSGIARTAIEGWDEEWHGCVYIDLPTGQVSWHYHDSHAELFADLPPYTEPWDGHDTDEKYHRLAMLKHHPIQAQLQQAVEALAFSKVAIDDWLNIYAEEECDPDRVYEARKRIDDAGGTLAYIARIQQSNNAVLATHKEKG